MLTMVNALEAVQAWLRETLADVQLQRPPQDERLESYELVAPEIYADLVPPGSVLPQGEEIRVPCVVVGLEQVESDAEETSYQVMLTAVVYDPGHQEHETENIQLGTDLNFDGYVTLLNFLDRIRAEVIRKQVIGDALKLEYPVTIKTYEAQPWPYWYGYLQFSLTGPAYPQTSYAQCFR